MKKIPPSLILATILITSVCVAVAFFYVLDNRSRSAATSQLEADGFALPVSYGTSGKTHTVFTDVTLESGIDFRHHQADEMIDSLPQVMGSGVCLMDYDNDGYLDIYFVNGSGFSNYFGSKPWWYKQPSNILYRNRRNGTFIDVTQKSGVGYTGWGMGCTVGDFNNDGHSDIYITNYGNNVLYKNNGNGAFTNITNIAGVGGKKEKWSTSAAWVDYDNDGWLDLYVLNYIKYDKYMNPPEPSSSFKIAGNLLMNSKIYTSAPNILYHNNRDGTFTEVTKKVGVDDSSGKGLGVVFSDMDSDGDQDLYIVNEGLRNVLFRNNGNGIFTDIGGEAGVDSPLSGMGVTVGDYDNDGDFDIFSTYPSHETNILYQNTLITPPPLMGGGKGEGSLLSQSLPRARHGGRRLDSRFRGNDRETGNAMRKQKITSRLLFKDATIESMLGEEISVGYFGWGTGFIDYDNDGYLDIFVANGDPSPDFDNPRTTIGQRNQLFHNNRAGGFIDVSQRAGSGLKIMRSSRGAAFGDLDNDGDVDIVINNNNDFASLLRNDGGNAGNWLNIKLIGVKSNRDGIGAEVGIAAGGLKQIREVRSSSSYLSQSDARLHFGLGRESRVDRLTIRWPSGITQILPGKVLNDVKADQFITVTEGKGEIQIDKRIKVRPHSLIKRKGTDIIDTEKALQTLKDRNPEKRRGAITSLMDVTDEEIIEKAIEPVIMTLEDSNKDVRKEAVRFFCKLFKEEQTILRATIYTRRLAVVPLLTLLDDPEPDIRKEAIKTLGYSESYRAIIPVARRLKDEESGVRHEAAVAIGRLRDKRGIDYLIEIVRNVDEDPLVRSGALLSLIRLESEITIEPLVEQMRVQDARIRLRALEVFKLALNDDESILLKRKEIINPIQEALKDSSTEVRCEAMKVIALMRDPVLIPSVIDALSDVAVEVKRDAINALGAIKDRRAVEPLIGLLSGETLMSQGLTKDNENPPSPIPLPIGERVRVRGRQVFSDENAGIRREAIKALAGLMDKRVVPVFLEIMMDKDEVVDTRILVISSLRQIDPVHWSKNIVLLVEDPNPDIRREAVKGVATLQDPDIVNLLIKCLSNDKDNRVRREVVLALGNYKDKMVVDSLINIVKSSTEEKDIRSAAITSLTRIGDEHAVIHLMGIAKNKRDELQGEASVALKKKFLPYLPQAFEGF